MTAAAFANLVAQFDQDNHIKGKQFEHLCKWFLENDPHYAELFTNVWLWEESPFDWGKDKGTDLVAQDRYGKLWAIQSKAYKATRAVTKAGIDSFLSDSSRAEIDHRLLIATTNRIGANAEDTFAIQEKGVSVVRLADLEAAEVAWPESLVDLIALQPEPKEPRDHQIEAINKVVDGFTDHDRGKLIMACGTGKTLTALFIKEKLGADRVLVLVPSLSLLKQTVREWTANRTVPFEYMAVCSDESVDSKYDRLVLRVSELRTPVKTDPADIKEFLQRPGPRVVFSTYQSSPQIAAAFELGDVADFDLIVADEAHRTIGHTHRDFATVLDGDKIKGNRRLFMTATPRDYTQRAKGVMGEIGVECASMDNEAIYGPVFHKLGFTDAIGLKLLTDYRLLIVGVDDFFYKDWVENGRYVSIDGKEVNARDLAVHIGLAKAMRDHDIRRAITFHSRIDGASGFAREFPNVIDWMPADQRPSGEIVASHVSSKMNAGQRENALRRLRNTAEGQRALLANARVLTEGVDVPALDGVAFIDPKQSETDIVQAVGRAIRLSPDKELGTIVIPVFIEPGQDAELALDGSAFQTVWNVVKALRSHDEELGQALDNIRIELGRRKKARHPSDKIEIDLTLAPSVGADFSDAIDLHMVEMTTASWMEWFGMLQEHYETHRTTYIKAKDSRLGGWSAHQRTLYRKGKLSADRVELLNNLGDWSWELWMEWFGMLQEHYETHRTTCIVVNSGPLGRWTGKQRHLYNKGKLSAERIQLLDNLGDWSWEPVNDQWFGNFEQLREHYETHDTTRVPSDHPLISWIKAQCVRHRSGKLPAAYAELLTNLGDWSWERRDARWEKFIFELQRYFEVEKTVRVLQSYKTPEGYPLGVRVSQQRIGYKGGKLSAERIEFLESIGDWTWDSRDSRDAEWEKFIFELQKYFEVGKTVRVIKNYKTPEGYQLGNRVAKQRCLYKNGKLSPERIEELESIGIGDWTWNVRDAEWEKFIFELQKYFEVEKTVRVPTKYKTLEGYQLGNRVATQRVFYKNGKLSAERIEFLESLGDWSWKLSPGPRSS